MRIASLKLLIFENERWKVEFVEKFLISLFAQVGGQDDKQSAFALGPALRQKQASLYRFSQTYFVPQYRAA